MTTLTEAIKQRLAETDTPDPLLLEALRRLEIAEEALEELSCLGNGTEPGNSIGNVKAKQALAAITAPFEDRG